MTVALHASTFEYLRPSSGQIEAMADFRAASATYARIIEELIPEGPDRTYMLRELRGLAMWGNVAITRQPDGSPREGAEALT